MRDGIRQANCPPAPFLRDQSSTHCALLAAIIQMARMLRYEHLPKVDCLLAELPGAYRAGVHNVLECYSCSNGRCESQHLREFGRSRGCLYLLLMSALLLTLTYCCWVHHSTSRLLVRHTSVYACATSDATAESISQERAAQHGAICQSTDLGYDAVDQALTAHGPCSLDGIWILTAL